jgi:hypothetical protein
MGVVIEESASALALALSPPKIEPVIQIESTLNPSS